MTTSDLCTFDLTTLSMRIAVWQFNDLTEEQPAFTVFDTNR